jgi:hypothetical protein
MSEKKDLTETRRTRLKKAHESLEAFASVIDGILTLIGGLRSLFDVIAPPAKAEEKSVKQD